MRKILLTALSFLFLQIAFSQAKTVQNTEFTYYIEITGINTKQSTKDFQKEIAKHTEVLQFQGYGIPRSFFLLYANKEIPQNIFKSWVLNSGYTIKVYQKKVLTPKFITNRVLNKKISILDQR